MSQGMVVISSKNTCLPDISNKKDCIIVNPKKINITISQIKKLYFSPKKIKTIGLNAIKTARKNSWSKYKTKLIKIILNEFKHRDSRN